MKIAVVTTMHAKAYETYGTRMLGSFLANWPEDVDFHIYTEDFPIRDITSPRLKVLDLHTTIPALVEFKTRHRDNPAAHGRQDRGSLPGHPRARVGLGYRWDAVRFANKSYVWCHVARTLGADRLIWLDADTLTHTPIPKSFLEGLIPADSLCGFLGRTMMYTETGFLILNLRHPALVPFVTGIEFIYQSDKVFELSEWHDCMVFDTMRQFMQNKGITFTNISGAGENTMHPFVNCDLGRYMDHMKGDRKVTGKSLKEDLVVRREEDYWKA